MGGIVIKRWYFIGIMVVAMLGVAVTAVADLYQWVDEEGGVHFSDEPPPPDNRFQDLERVPSPPQWPVTASEAPDRVEGTAPSQSSSTKQLPEVKPFQASKKVELYVTKWCKYCTMARNYLRSKNVPFVEYDIEKDSAAAKRREALEKRSGVPLAVINDTVILGFSEAAYEKALNRR